MTITVQCPLCMKQFHVKDDAAGKKFRCTACKESITIPAQKPIARRRQEEEELDFVGDDGDFGEEPLIPVRRSRRSVARSTLSGSMAAAIGAGIGLILVILLAVLSMRDAPAQPSASPSSTSLASSEPVVSGPIPSNDISSVAGTGPIHPFQTHPPSFPQTIPARPGNGFIFQSPNPDVRQFIPKNPRTNVPPGTRVVIFSNVTYQGTEDVSALAQRALAGIAWLNASTVQYHPETKQLSCFAVGTAINTTEASTALRGVGIETRGVALMSR